MNIWKLLLATSLILVFSGCNSRTQNIQLRNVNAQQSHTIKQQKLLIDALKAKLGTRASTSYRTTPRSTTPEAPKKEIELKKVEDNNYSSGYMYPKAKKKIVTAPKVVTTTNTTTAMTKAECIGMIGAEKFAKYTQMFGSEASSLKRCSILKAMKN